MYNAIIRDKLISEFGLEATIKYAKMEAFRYKYLFEISDKAQRSEYDNNYEAEWWKSEAKYMEKQLNTRHNEHKGEISEGVADAKGMDEA
jgi:hypothetical protein